MNLLGGLLDRLLLVLGTIAGGCIPSFILQYRQRLGGRLDQVQHDLAPFQEIANRLHGGNIQALIKHHLNSTDTTFHDEGAAIQAMIDSLARLREAAQALDTDLWHQINYMLHNADPELAHATWSAFSPAFVLNADSIILALGIGVGLWLLFIGLWYATALAARKIRYAF